MAKEVHERLERDIDEVMADLQAGRNLDLAKLKDGVDAMVDSILRNPAAFSWIKELKRRDDYGYHHALGCAIWAASFGRHLGLEREEVQKLALGGLLCDIGMIRVPMEMLTKEGKLEESEADLVRRHVAHGLEILRGTEGISDKIVEIVETHHERHDGSGYPKGLKGKDIGMLGSIGAIVDTFDALTARRPYAAAVSPSAALSMLYKWRGQFFDAELVEQFIRCIGIFPLGSVVELNTGEVGIVIAQNLEKRLQPRVMVIRDAAGSPLRPQKLLDLARAPKSSASETYRIKRTLEYGKAPVSAESLFKN